MPEAAFDVKFDGPALDDGRMPVRDLAPALMALGELFVAAGKVVNPNAPPVSLEIKATREGSFIADLILLGQDGPWDQMADLARSIDRDTLETLVMYVLGVSGGAPGVIGLIKWIKGKSDLRREVVDDGLVKYTDADGNSLEVPSPVDALNENRRVRKSAKAVVEPLAREGVERLDFRRDSEVVESVTASDVPAFALPEPRDDEPPPPDDHEIDVDVEVVSPSFAEGNKWRVAMGESTFHAAIEDDGFWRRVSEREDLFGAGDRLRCRLRIEQSEQGGKLNTEHTIIEVHAHIPREVQLPFEDGGDP